MATKMKRLQITPTAEMWQTIDRFHAATGQPRGQIVVEFMQPVLEQMNGIVDLLERVQSMRGEALDDVRRVSETALERLEAVALEAADALLSVDSAIDPKPPASNTGATTHQHIENIEPGHSA